MMMDSGNVLAWWRLGAPYPAKELAKINGKNRLSQRARWDVDVCLRWSMFYLACCGETGCWQRCLLCGRPCQFDMGPWRGSLASLTTETRSARGQGKYQPSSKWENRNGHKWRGGKKVHEVTMAISPRGHFQSIERTERLASARVGGPTANPIPQPRYSTWSAMFLYTNSPK